MKRKPTLWGFRAGDTGVVGVFTVFRLPFIVTIQHAGLVAHTDDVAEPDRPSTAAIATHFVLRWTTEDVSNGQVSKNDYRYTVISNSSGLALGNFHG